jgi:hypothetical protein
MYSRLDDTVACREGAGDALGLERRDEVRGAVDRRIVAGLARAARGREERLGD